MVKVSTYINKVARIQKQTTRTNIYHRRSLGSKPEALDNQMKSGCFCKVERNFEVQKKEKKNEILPRQRSNRLGRILRVLFELDVDRK